MTKTQAKSIITRLEKERAKIGANRDNLRKLLDEVEPLIESCDRAEEGIQTAIDALSEYA